MQPEPDWEVAEPRRQRRAQRPDRGALRARRHRAVAGGGGDHRGGQRRLSGPAAEHVTSQLRTMYDRAAHAGIRVVAGTIVPYNTATADQNERMRQHQRLDSRAGTRTRHVAFVDTRAAVAAPETRTGWPNRPTGCIRRPGLPADGRGHPPCAIDRRLARYPVGVTARPSSQNDEPHYVFRIRSRPGVALAAAACRPDRARHADGARRSRSARRRSRSTSRSPTAAKRLVPDLAARGLRGLRQRQAADAHELRQRSHADHRRRHARHERQHDARHSIS